MGVDLVVRKQIMMRAFIVWTTCALSLCCTAELELPEMPTMEQNTPSEFIEDSIPAAEDPATDAEEVLDMIQDKLQEGDRKSVISYKNEVLRSKEALAKYGLKCKAVATALTKATGAIASHKSAVTKAIKESNKICDKEKKQEEKSKEKKKKLNIEGPTFKFPVGQPCKGGKGNFVMKLKLNQRVPVGVIPANMPNIWVKLRTDKDVDTELWTANGKREMAIVAWRVGKIDSPTAASIKYAGGTIKYSGYNGIASKNGALNFGHEDIQIVGKSTSSFMMKAFAFEAGTARITYSWGADFEKCKAQKALVRKEKKAKYDAKVSLNKKMNEGQYKAALKVLQGNIKGCKGAKKWTTTTKTELMKALKVVTGHKVSLSQCNKSKEKSEKGHEKLVKKEKANKEKNVKLEKASKEKKKKEKMAKGKQAKEKKTKELAAKKKELAAKEKKMKEKAAKEKSE